MHLHANVLYGVGHSPSLSIISNETARLYVCVCVCARTSIYVCIFKLAEAHQKVEFRDLGVAGTWTILRQSLLLLALIW